MMPQENVTAEQLIGKKVAFKDDESHQDCWHHRMGLRTGVVKKVGHSLTEKAELLAAEGLAMPELPDVADAPRLWVLADPSPSLPRGCETAVELYCLLLLD